MGIPLFLAQLGERVLDTLRKMGIITLCKSIKKINEFKDEAKEILANVEEEGNVCSNDYKKWQETYRINTVACSSFISGQLCGLEGIDFDISRRKIAYFGSASACISDDVIDKNPDLDARRFRFLDSQYHSNGKDDETQRLFYTFHSGLENLLPNEFKERFNQLIEKYNQFQEMAGDLKKDITPEEVLNIKNGTGGYPILLLHRMMFPRYWDIPQNFSPNYDSSNIILPRTKDEAIFNFGALISRIDDLSDLEWDLKDSRKSLATEKLVTWNSLNEDIKYVKEGLARFYPDKRVKSAMRLYSAPTMHAVHNIENLVYKIRSKK